MEITTEQTVWVSLLSLFVVMSLDTYATQTVPLSGLVGMVLILIIYKKWQDKEKLIKSGTQTQVMQYSA